MLGSPATPSRLQVASHRALLAVLLLLASLCILPHQLHAQSKDSKAIGVESVREVVSKLPSQLRTPNRYALVIGANDYVDKRITDLPACANDARGLSRLLLSPTIGMFPKDRVTTLTGKEVTQDNIIDALDQLGRQAGADDLVLIFFSGHGATDARGRSYWVMHDTEVDRLRATALPETEITELIGEIKAKRLVTFIDACYAASTANVGQSKSLMDLAKLYPKFDGKGRLAMTASRGDQLSVVISDKKHPGYGYSAFAWHLINGMKGAADGAAGGNREGVVTVDELWGYVKDRTETTARKMGGNQRPQLKGQLGSRFLLTVDADRLVRASLGVKKQLASLKQLFIDEAITIEQYKQASDLITTPDQKLNEQDQKRKQVYTDLAEGTLAAHYLQSALDSIETPAQRQARLAREAAMKAEAERQAKIATLWGKALANDSKANGKTALEALGTLLKLVPDHSQALALQKKIKGYYGPEITTVNLGNGVTMNMVKIKAGKFTMGTPVGEEWQGTDSGQKGVTIARDFYLGQTEVTQAQWQAVMGTRPWKGTSYVKEGADYPATLVSWDDAKAFVVKLSRLTGKRFRLPSEAEWEYACRAGTTTAYSFGDSDYDHGDYGWFSSNARDAGNKYAHRVGTKKANAWGLYDMHGNVFEWCEDRCARTFRVLRGGSWNNDPYYCRSFNRTGNAPAFRNYLIGFRVVLHSLH